MILVTGANGFLGRALCRQLHMSGVPLRAIVRSVRGDEAVPVTAISQDSPDELWRAQLRGVSCVVHLAARTPIPGESQKVALKAFGEANVRLTRRVAENAASMGVGRFVFLSSIKVHGDVASDPLTETVRPRPVDAYGMSKLEAEYEVRKIAEGANMEWVILRPPVVYGPGVRGNFPALVSAIRRRMPLPLGAIHNRRSIVYLGNLVDVVQLCISSSAVNNQFFLVNDHEAISTPDMVRRLAHALGLQVPYLAPVPPWMLRLAGRALGRRAMTERLTRSLEIDGSLLKSRLGWMPRFSMDHGFADMALSFLPSAHGHGG